MDETIEKEEEALEAPPDMFSIEEMTVNQGDNVVIHFYNLEPVETLEHHTFTMFAPYEMNTDLNAGETRIIEFVASESGIFGYQCVFHQPTMSG